MSGFTVGRDKKPIDSLDRKDLEYWEKQTAADIRDPEKSNWLDSNKKKLDALRARLTVVRGEEKQENEARTKTIAKIEATSLGAAANNPQAITAQLRELAENYHIVSPATRVDVIPEGCGVAINYVTVDTTVGSNGPGEVYQVGDKLGLSMTTLKKIAAAAGIDWDPNQSGRIDNGSDPQYCRYRAVGLVRNFDSSLRTVTGEVEMDLRDGSPQVEEIRQKADARAKKNNATSDGGASQILELRKFILRHAESKAKNRAIADIGIKRSYNPAELKKPFAVARLMWTGQSDDPELRRRFALMQAEKMQSSIASLYGRHAPTSPYSASPQLGGYAPPPARGTVETDFEQISDDSEW